MSAFNGNLNSFTRFVPVLVEFEMCISLVSPPFFFLLHILRKTADFPLNPSFRNFTGTLQKTHGVNGFLN